MRLHVTPKRRTEQATAPEAEGVPISLSVIAERMGRHLNTLRRYRELGMLQTINICGREYCTPQQLRRFNERCEAGEFSKTLPVPEPPNKKVRA